MIFNLHLLRAFAALAVVYYHISSDSGLNLPLNVGNYGVDVFFVISGFIISFIGTRAPDQFLLRRVIRIVPFYWTATILLFAMAAIVPRLLHHTQADIKQLIYSLFFIPHANSAGEMFPTLRLGWSLNYEMYFYFLFAVSLCLWRLSAAPIVCSLFISINVALIDLFAPNGSLVRYYAEPIVFEFVFGVGAYYLCRVADDHATRILQRLRLGEVLILLAICSAGALFYLEYYRGNNLPRLLVAGVPAAVLVTSCILVERIYQIAARFRIVYLLGESSYILYLIHPYIIYGVLRVSPLGRESLTMSSAILLTVSLMLVCVAVSVAIHVFFEKPFMVALHERLIRQHKPS